MFENTNSTDNIEHPINLTNNSNKHVVIKFFDEFFKELIKEDDIDANLTTMNEHSQEQNNQ